MHILKLFTLPDNPLPTHLLPLWALGPGCSNTAIPIGPGWLVPSVACSAHARKDGSSSLCLSVIGPCLFEQVFYLPRWAVQGLHAFWGPWGLLGWEDRGFPQPLTSATTLPNHWVRQSEWSSLMTLYLHTQVTSCGCF